MMHYSDVIMGMMASQITSLTSVYSTVHSGEDQREHQSSASLAFVRGIHRWPVKSPHKGPVTRKMFPFDDVIMFWTHNRTHSLPSRASNYMSDHCVYVEKHRPRYKAITLYDIRMSQMSDNGEGLGVVTLTMESYIIMPSYGGSITRSLIPYHVVGFITRSDITRDCINHWNH